MPCTSLEVIFIIDSSGSVYVSGTNDPTINFKRELDTAKEIINISLPIQSSRVGLINFGGNGKIVKGFGLNEFGVPYNNLTSVYNRVDGMGEADFQGGLHSEMKHY